MYKLIIHVPASGEFKTSIKIIKSVYIFYPETVIEDALVLSANCIGKHFTLPLISLTAINRNHVDVFYGWPADSRLLLVLPVFALIFTRQMRA